MIQLTLKGATVEKQHLRASRLELGCVREMDCRCCCLTSSLSGSSENWYQKTRSYKKDITKRELSVARLRGWHRLDHKRTLRFERVLHPVGEGSQRCRTWSQREKNKLLDRFKPLSNANRIYFSHGQPAALEVLQCGPSKAFKKRYSGAKSIRSLEKIQIWSSKWRFL